MRRRWAYAGALVTAVLLPAVRGASYAQPAVPAPTRTELARSYVLPYQIAKAPASAAKESSLLALLNRARRAAGLDPLTASTALRTVARRHGSDMFAHGYLSHQLRDGRLPIARVEAAGLTPWYVGENLAYASDIRNAHQSLMKSPHHRANILWPLYRWIGVAVMDGGARGVVVVEDFTD